MRLPLASGVLPSAANKRFSDESCDNDFSEVLTSMAPGHSAEYERKFPQEFSQAILLNVSSSPFRQL